MESLAEIVANLIIFILYFGFFAGLGAIIGYLFIGNFQCWFLGLLIGFWFSPFFLDL